MLHPEQSAVVERCPLIAPIGNCEQLSALKASQDWMGWMVWRTWVPSAVIRTTYFPAITNLERQGQVLVTQSSNIVPYFSLSLAIV